SLFSALPFANAGIAHNPAANTNIVTCRNFIIRLLRLVVNWGNNACYLRGLKKSSRVSTTLPHPSVAFDPGLQIIPVEFVRAWATNHTLETRARPVATGDLPHATIEAGI
ncbi:MAG TPA: hypothetical protein VGH83_01990, partial [Candidatus Acidoferrum sp.]